MGCGNSKEAEKPLAGGKTPPSPGVNTVKFSPDTKDPKLPDPNKKATTPTTPGGGPIPHHSREKSITGGMRLERTGSQASLTDERGVNGGGGGRVSSSEGKKKHLSARKKSGTQTSDSDLMKNLGESLVSLNSFGTNVRDVYDGLDGDLVLGTGNWGVVKVVTRKRDGKKFACKIVKLDPSMTDQQIEELRTEINALRQLDHVSVAKLFETFEEPGQMLYLIMELLTGGELYTALVERSPTGRFDEIRTRKLARRMVSAIAYLHDRGLVHRDIKLENFCFRGDETDDEIVLIDFGLAKLYDMKRDGGAGKNMTEVVGSSYYIAPEIVEGNYSGPTPDVWSLGVIIFMMLCGRPPFDGTNDANIMRKTLKGKYDMDDEVWRMEISTLAQDFVRRCLTRDVNLRMTSKEALRHQWLTASEETLIDCGAGDDPARALALGSTNQTEDLIKVARRASRRISANLFGSDLGEIALDRLRTFASRHELVRIFSQAVAFSLGREELKDLVKVFVKLDRDSDGYITAADVEVGLLGAPPEEADDNVPHVGAADTLHTVKSPMNGSLPTKMLFTLGTDEATRNKKRRRRETNYLFSAMDVQRHGKVSLNEFLAATLDERVFFKDERLLSDAFSRLLGGADESGGVTNGHIPVRMLESLLGNRYTEKRAKRLIGEFVAIARFGNHSGLPPAASTSTSVSTPTAANSNPNSNPNNLEEGKRSRSNRFSLSLAKTLGGGANEDDDDSVAVNSKNAPRRVDVDRIGFDDFRRAMTEIAAT